MAAHVVSLYEIENLAGLSADYRLAEIDGPFGCERDEDLADKNLNLLLKQFMYRERAAAALVERDGRPMLAFPSDLVPGDLEYALTPHVVTLRPRDEVHRLSYAGLTPELLRVGLAFLNYHLRSPLMQDPDLWRSGANSFLDKRPVNWREAARDADVYGGFSFRLVRHDGRLFVALRLSHRYAESACLIDHRAASDLRGLRMRHLLYRFGDRWFTVQLLGVTGNAIAEQKFQPEGGSITNVYDYTLAKAGAPPPSWVQTLDPDSPAIRYRYPGNEKQRYGAAALCKLMLNTEDPRVRGVHGRSIVAPGRRFELLHELAQRRFAAARLGGVPVRVRPHAHRSQAQRFPVPSQLFGGGRVLRVLSRDEPDGVELAALGQSRMDHVLDPRYGLAVTRSFGSQYLLVPRSLPRPVAEAFRDRLEKVVRQMAQAPFTLRPVLYRDAARTLKEQVDAISEAVDRAEIEQGHGVLILPEHRSRDLHQFVKRALLGRLQLQCAAAERLSSFYELRDRNGREECRVRDERDRHYTSYLRYAALGLVILNRQWPWVLEKGTNYDVYVGIDVLHNTAAFTFFYEGGRRCFVRTHQSKQNERLLRRDTHSVLYEHLKTDLPDCPARPRSLVLRRDGRIFDSEWRGFQDAVAQLIRDGLLANGVITGAVEVHKHSAAGLRLAAEGPNGLGNPDVGSWFAVDRVEGVVCTTGSPFRFSGTVNPLAVKVARGPLDLAPVLQDVFDMSQLCWMVPDRCIRLPIDLKLCDEFLRSVAAEPEEEEAMDDDTSEADTEAVTDET